MKAILGVIAICTVFILGCNQKEKELEQQVGQLQSERGTLQQNLADRDKDFEEVIRSVNEVYADLELARSKEAKIVQRSGGTEGPVELATTDTRQKLLANIGEIGTTLKENRKKISGLESRVKTFRGEVAGLNTLIANLKQNLQEREQSIAQLESRVTGLETTVAENTKVISEKETVIDEQQKTMNTAFYVVGTRKELEEKGIISDEGGFLWGLLGSTTTLASGFDRSLFTPIDRTTGQIIPVEGEIEEILPHRRDEYFAMAEPVGNSSALTIVKPDAFWQDDYLVIVLD